MGGGGGEGEGEEEGYSKEKSVCCIEHIDPQMENIIVVSYC